MSKSKSLIFFGTEAFSLSALEALVEGEFNIVAVVTKPDSPKNRSKKLKPSVVKLYALESNLPVTAHSSSEDIEKDLRQYGAFAGVLSSFGKIIPASTLEMFPGGIINIHPSALPKYRGASPIEQTILNGDKNTGVSLMKLVEKMDAGPIYAQATQELSGKETAPELYKTLATVGSKLLISNLPAILSNRLKPWAQNDSEASFAPMLAKKDSIVDWNQSAEEIERQVRAYLKWPGTKTTLAKRNIAITQASTSNDSGTAGAVKATEKGILVACGVNSLVIERLKPDGKREMSAKEFLSGNEL